MKTVRIGQTSNCKSQSNVNNVNNNDDDDEDDDDDDDDDEEKSDKEYWTILTKLILISFNRCNITN